MSGLSDEELIGRTARFETDAFAELYDRHSSVAFAVSRRMLGPTLAQDAVQDAFLGIWRGASTFDASRGAGRAWLLRIVRYRSLDALRRLGVGARRAIDAQRLQERAADPESVHATAQRNEAAAAVAAALRGLPDDQRQVIELAYFDGLTQVEISERLGLPLGTVKSRARLALHKLRAELDPTVQTAE